MGAAMRTSLLSLLAVAALAPASAGGTPPDPAAAQDEIVVTGSRSPQRAIGDYVDVVTVESAGQIARFATPVCPAGFGLPDGHNEVIATRIRQIADHLGIGSAPAGCRPNIVVIVADRGADFVSLLRRERPALFAAFELFEIREVTRLAGPVRAWQAVEARGADGRPMERIAWLEMGGGPPKYIPHGYRLDGVMPSLTQRPTRQDLSMAFVVFDLDALEGLTLLQIADHAAMRALARTSPAALPARRSILTLFTDQAAGGGAPELTGWDVAYLSALSRTGNTVSAHQQRSSIARTMRREVESRPAQQ